MDITPDIMALLRNVKKNQAHFFAAIKKYPVFIELRKEGYVRSTEPVDNNLDIEPALIGKFSYLALTKKGEDLIK